METQSLNLPPLMVPAPGTGEDFVVPDPGLYELVIAEILETRQSMFNGQVKEGKIDVRFKFQVVGGEFDGVWFKQWFGYSLHEKSKLRPVLLAIRNNRPIDASKPVELTNYLNKPFRGLVQVDEVPSREDATRILKFAKVVSAMPMQQQAARRSAPPPPVEPDGEDDPFDE